MPIGNIEKTLAECLDLITRLKERQFGVANKDFLVLEKNLLLLRLGLRPTRFQFRADVVERKILELIRRHGQLDITGLISGLGLKITKRNIKRYLARLVSAKRLVRNTVNNNQSHYSLPKN